MLETWQSHDTERAGAREIRRLEVRPVLPSAVSNVIDCPSLLQRLAEGGSEHMGPVVRESDHSLPWMGRLRPLADQSR